MSENASNNNRTVMMLLGVVVILLAALVVVVIMRQPATPVASTTTTAAAAASTAATSMPGVGSSTAATFDPKTATKVPTGVQPKDFVAGYYQNIMDKKWAAAFAMQPATSRAGGTVADFQATEAGYGMTSFKLMGQKITGDTATVVIQQDLGTNGIWGATWTLVKNGSTWLVKTRTVSMGTPTAP
jgi:hypothetical protein